MSLRPSAPPLRGVTARPVIRLGRDDDDHAAAPAAGPGDAPEVDEVVVEEPLEIRVAGETVATTMRTPGHDRQLAVGFLFSEGLVASRDDVGAVAHCGHPGEEGYGNVIDVTPGAGTVIDVERLGASRRGTLVTTAACGVCGRRSIDDLLARCAPQLDDETTLAPAAITAAVARMSGTQAVFARTGGIHAAGLFDRDGGVRAVFEDIGRHNAVDKAVGQLVLDGVLRARTPEVAAAAGAPGRPVLLVVSGRASFEMVQKAVVARVPIVASVSAASSLAIDLAARTNTTLVGFVRGARLNVYTAPGRVRPD